MPGVVRKLMICAAIDGLFLHPIGAKDRDSKSVKIAYGTNAIKSASRTDESENGAQILEAHGIVGLLNLISTSYLITITRREQVAQIKGKPIYAISDVALIPLSSQSEAQRALSAVEKTLDQGSKSAAEETDISDVGEDGDNTSIGESENEQPLETAAAEPPKRELHRRSSSVVKNVVQDRGRYGRFAESWFSKSGWAASGRRRQGMTSEENLADDQKTGTSETPPSNETATDARPEPGSGEEETNQDTKTPTSAHRSVIESLTPRILRAARLYFSSSGFFFSYEHDLTRTLTEGDVQMSSLPLWKHFDPGYFWNRHLASPFIDARQDAIVLPLLQGFVGQRTFSIARTQGAEQDIVAEATQKPEETVIGHVSTKSADNKDNWENFLLTVISRRATRRAGLRYLRRGVDDEGNVANYVETEQILSRQSWDTSAKTFSLVQIRGSIPLFFSQSPYSFKPLPVMFGSEATNQAAFRVHFDKITRRYGSVQVASLVDKHSTEVSIGKAFEHHAKLLSEQGGVNGEQVGFEWFDFHSVCKGMRFDKVGILLDALQSSLASFGWGVRQGDHNIRLQTGVLRTNCMDCLDRTNVVQSAVAGWALQQQLAELGLNIDLQNDSKTKWFNTLWADNGDAISRQYAGTAALKGDYTRTRKRNWTGALSDFTLTLNRYYNNIFSDYFLQLNIDFFLGKVGPVAFEEFEADMMGQDYALDVKRIRQNAIDTCIKIVLEDPNEDLIAGWTLSCPRNSNTLRSLPFEECVLLLTDSALYFCRFNWDTEKVGSFERVDLLDITEIWRGAYITNTLNPTHMDETKNVGFALRYETSGRALVRTNSRALGNEQAAEDESRNMNELQKQAMPENRERHLLAFKVLPPTSSAVKGQGNEGATMSESEMVKHICDEIQKTITTSARKQRGLDDLELDKLPQVEAKDVISAADAKKSTGYIESLGYSLKKLVWS